MPTEPDDTPRDFEGDSEADQSTDVAVAPKTKTPSFYKVLILNDDFTPRDFVVVVLEKFFRKNVTEATELMLDVHHKGVGVAGVYTYEIAETKSVQVNEYAKQNHYPLRCVVERE